MKTNPDVVCFVTKEMLAAATLMTIPVSRLSE
jgi:hypothetical protein